jgi:hypothetical protein
MSTTAGHNRRLLLVCIGALGLTSGGKASPQRRIGSLRFWRMEGYLGWGLNEPTQRVVKTRSEFLKLWTQIHIHSPRVPSPPYIDFSKEMVLVNGMGQRSSGGYSIRTERIEDEGNSIVVFSRTRSPGPNCMTSASFTSPVELIRLERSSKPVRFISTNEVVECN